LEVFTREGVMCHPFRQLLSDLARHGGRSFFSSAGGDLAEIISYYKTYETGNA
jgi:energy-converting hydrogenase Eha subunit F